VVRRSRSNRIRQIYHLSRSGLSEYTQYSGNREPSLRCNKPRGFLVDYDDVGFYRFGEENCRPLPSLLL
jgi:hypothetical protein